MKTQKERIMLALEAGKVKRCHAFPINSDVTIGNHTYGALALLLILCPDPSINLIRAVTFHDVGERFLGDMPAPAKRKDPKLGALYETLEQEVLNDYGFLPKLTETEQRWLKAVDMLEFMLCMRHERNLGNLYAVQRYHRVCEYIDKLDLPEQAKAFYIDVKSEVNELQDDQFL